MKKFFPLVAVFLMVGCGKITPAKNPDMVDVSGTVMMGGKPLSGVILNLQPTGTGTQAAFAVSDGKFKGSATPGKYTYYISEPGGKENILPSIPKKYHAGAMDRQVDVSSGSTLTITLD